MDEEIELKKDLIQCITNNMNLDANYGAMLFQGDRKEHYMALWSFQKLTIQPYKDQLNYKGILDKEIMDIVNKDNIEVIKGIAVKNNLEEIVMQQFKENVDQEKLELKIMEELSKVIEKAEKIMETKKYRKLKEEDIVKLLITKETLKLNYGLESEIKVSKETAFVLIKEDKIEFNSSADICSFTKLSDIFDYFYILPQYDEESEDCKGVRILFGIDLTEE